jgi:hypothetical protein
MYTLYYFVFICAISICVRAVRLLRLSKAAAATASKAQRNHGDQGTVKVMEMGQGRVKVTDSFMKEKLTLQKPSWRQRILNWKRSKSM